MSATRITLPRIEGGTALVQDDDGHIRLAGPPPRLVEQQVAGRSPWEAVYLTQLVTADGGIGHALAATAAWEAAAGLGVAENGRVLREFLHATSLLHANLRHFYQQVLPDYVPPGSVTDYEGSFPELQHLRAGIAKHPKDHWSRQNFDHPFRGPELRQLWEHTVLATRVLATLQRMLAVVGGKYPVAMSVVPGGMNTPLSGATVLRLRGYLNEVRELLTDALPADADLLLKRWTHIRKLGRGQEDFLCAGSGEGDMAFESSLFPSGVYLGGKLERFSAVATESIERSYYRLAQQQPARGSVVVPAPEKEGAVSWIKAPRYAGRVPETGTFARLVISYLSGARMSDPGLVERLEKRVDLPLQQANTVGGRLLAGSEEPAALVERCDVLLDQLDPAHPTALNEGDPFGSSGEGTGHIEGPAGAVQHRLGLERGKIAYYDIISPSTWNGSPADAEGQTGSLLVALNRARHDLASPGQQREASRIVQSFAFSMSDAVQ